MADGRIKAVHDDDLPTLLRGLELWDTFQAQKLTCKFCGATLTLDNLAAIFPDGHTVSLCCDRPPCIRALNATREAGA